MPDKLKLGVFKFASCDGCQLAVLDAEDQLLQLADTVDIAYFLEASSRIDPGPYDVSLVEGSVATPHHLERIRDIRQRSKYLVTIGACATAGGIQALRNWADHEEFLRAVYPSPQQIAALAQSTPIGDHVPVDFELRGCPINPYQLLEVLRSLVAGRRPRTPNHSVCLDCKRRGTVCITVARGIPCLGPITHTGCGAICPAYDRGCYGCYGPAEQPNPESLIGYLSADPAAAGAMFYSLRSYNGYAPAFRQAGDQLARHVEGSP